MFMMVLDPRPCAGWKPAVRFRAGGPTRGHCDNAPQYKVLAAVEAEHQILLIAQQSGQQHGSTATRRCLAMAGASRVRGPARMLATDQIVGPALRITIGWSSPSAMQSGCAVHGICLRIGACRFDRDRIDIGCHHGRFPEFCRRNGEHASAAANVQNVRANRRRFASGDIASRQSAVDSWWPVPKAESGFDADRNDAGRNAASIMRAIEEEPSRAHRRQSFEAVADPVLIGQGSQRTARPHSRDKVQRPAGCRKAPRRSHPLRTGLRQSARIAARAASVRTAPRHRARPASAASTTAFQSGGFISRAGHETVHDALRPCLVEIDQQLVAFHRDNPAIAEFLVKYPLAGAVEGGLRFPRLRPFWPAHR